MFGSACPQFARSVFFALILLAAAAYAGICNDKRLDCANWARDGECSGENAVRPCASSAAAELTHAVVSVHLLLWQRLCLRL